MFLHPLLIFKPWQRTFQTLSLSRDVLREDTQITRCFCCYHNRTMFLVLRNLLSHSIRFNSRTKIFRDVAPFGKRNYVIRMKRDSPISSICFALDEVTSLLSHQGRVFSRDLSYADRLLSIDQTVRGADRSITQRPCEPIRNSFHDAFHANRNEGGEQGGRDDRVEFMRSYDRRSLARFYVNCDRDWTESRNDLSTEHGNSIQRSS